MVLLAVLSIQNAFAQSDSQDDLVWFVLEEASTGVDLEIVLTEEVLEAVPVEEVLDVFDEDGHEGDDPVQDVLCDDLAEGGLGVALDKGVFEDFLADGDLVIVPTEGVLEGEPTDNGLGVVLDEEVRVDFLVEGDLVDVPAQDVL